MNSKTENVLKTIILNKLGGIHRIKQLQLSMLYLFCKYQICNTSRCGGGATSSVAASLHQDAQFDLELRLLSRFSSFFPPTKNIPVGGLATLKSVRMSLRMRTPSVPGIGSGCPEDQINKSTNE